MCVYMLCLPRLLLYYIYKRIFTENLIHSRLHIFDKLTTVNLIKVIIESNYFLSYRLQLIIMRLLTEKSNSILIVQFCVWDIGEYITSWPQYNLVKTVFSCSQNLLWRFHRICLSVHGIISLSFQWELWTIGLRWEKWTKNSII